MERQRTIPWLGGLFALLAAVALAVSGEDLVTAAAVLLVWLGSLWLSAGKAPRVVQQQAPAALSSENVRAVLELSASPQLLTERGKVTVMNDAARQIVGAHLLGQDARVAFRHPEAIELLNSERTGSCTIRNFLRPQDCWQMRRQIADDEVALIELADRTAEVVVSRAHTDFVANASHELRTPLAAIIGYVETLREVGESIPPDKADRFLSHIEQEAKRLHLLVSDLMSLSRIEAEKHDAPAVPVLLGQLVKRAALDAAGPNRAARLKFVLDEQVMVTGDAAQIEQVVRNLVDNSLKYGSDTGRVEIAVAAADTRYAQITVSDQGAGIAKEHLPHLTRRFYRTDPGRSRTSGGTGLGLAIVKHIVDRHRGRLDIDSKQGRGTSVVVRLPLAAETEPRPSQTGEPVDVLQA